MKPIQDNYINLINNKDYLNNILNEGSEYAIYKSRKTLSKVYRKVGLINKQLWELTNI